MLKKEIVNVPYARSEDALKKYNHQTGYTRTVPPISAYLSDRASEIGHLIILNHYMNTMVRIAVENVEAREITVANTETGENDLIGWEVTVSITVPEMANQD